jgi:hypothetical protein
MVPWPVPVQAVRVPGITSSKLLAGAGATLVGLGLAAAVATPLLLKAPVTQTSHLTASGTARLLDPVSGTQRTGTFVQDTRISGRRNGSNVVATYQQRATQSFVDAAGARRQLATSTLTQAFDRRTGEGRPGAAGDTLGTRAHLFKLLFGTRKQTYRIWDETAKRAVPLVYTGEKRVRGLPAYVFTRDVPPTDLGPLPVFRAVPGSFVGHPELASIAAHEWYESRGGTLYVEPVTGSIVGGASSPHLWAQTASGQRVDLLTVTGATPEPADAARLVRDAKQARAQVLLLRRAPWVLGALGALLLPGSVAAARRRTPTDVRALVPAQRRPGDGVTSVLSR